MYNVKWLVIFIIVFVGFAAFPLLYNLGTKEPAPQLDIGDKARMAGSCIMDKATMRTQHMQILDKWRDKVVRHGERTTTINGKTYEISLSNTCLGCHDKRDEFCIKCHDYVSVRVYCWDCHVDPAKGQKEVAQWAKP